MQLPAFERRGLGRLAEELADRDAVHDEPRGRVEVREHEDADGAADRRRDPAGRPDAGLPALRHHPRSRSDGPLGHGASGRSGDRATGVGRVDLDDAALREPAVVALAYDRDDEVLGPDTRLDLDRDGDRSVVHPAHRVRRREVDGRLDAAPVADLQRSGELTRPVEHGGPRGHGKRVQRLDRSGENGRHPGPGDAASLRRLGLVAPDRDVPDGHARHVGDRVRRAGVEAADAQPVLAEREDRAERVESSRERTFAPLGDYALARLHAGGHNFDGVDVVKASGATTPDTGGEMKRRQSGRLMLVLLGAVALVAAGSAAWIGSQRATASPGAAAARPGRGERDPARGHDELHRLVQPVQLHRGAGTERDGDGLPAARPGRLLEEGGVLHRRRLGEVVEGHRGRQDLDVQAPSEREAGRTASR